MIISDQKYPILGAPAGPFWAAWGPPKKAPQGSLLENKEKTKEKTKENTKERNKGKKQTFQKPKNP